MDDTERIRDGCGDIVFVIDVNVDVSYVGW
jgi:hypothetical protein